MVWEFIQRYATAIKNQFIPPGKVNTVQPLPATTPASTEELIALKKERRL